jgi:hypothetical protein
LADNEIVEGTEIRHLNARQIAPLWSEIVRLELNAAGVEGSIDYAPIRAITVEVGCDIWNNRAVAG